MVRCTVYGVRRGAEGTSNDSGPPTLATHLWGVWGRWWARLLWLAHALRALPRPVCCGRALSDVAHTLRREGRDREREGEREEREAANRGRSSQLRRGANLLLAPSAAARASRLPQRSRQFWLRTAGINPARASGGARPMGNPKNPPIGGWAVVGAAVYVACREEHGDLILSLRAQSINIDEHLDK